MKLYISSLFFNDLLTAIQGLVQVYYEKKVFFCLQRTAASVFISCSYGVRGSCSSASRSSAWKNCNHDAWFKRVWEKVGKNFHFPLRITFNVLNKSLICKTGFFATSINFLNMIRGVLTLPLKAFTRHNERVHWTID